MPLYSFRKKRSKYTYELMMSYDEKLKYLEENPDIVSVIDYAPAIGDAYRMGITKKNDGAMREILQKVKKAHPLSTIDTGNINSV